MSEIDQTLERLEQVPALRQRVHDRLESLIITGALKPGERLVESELADRLGVSRGPVREALQLLERDGWIDLRSRHGAFVHDPTEKEIDDFFDLRRVLEVESARLAALNATSQDIETLHAAVERGRGLLAQGQDPFLVDTRATFHEQVARVGGNTALVRMLTLLSKRAAWFLRPLNVTREAQWDEHAAIADAIGASDVARATSLMAEHVDNSRRSYKQLRDSAAEVVTSSDMSS